MHYCSIFKINFTFNNSITKFEVFTKNKFRKYNKAIFKYEIIDFTKIDKFTIFISVK